MIAALTLLLMAGLNPSGQAVMRPAPVSGVQPAVVRPSARAVAPTAPAVRPVVPPVVRVPAPIISPVVLEGIAPSLREAAVCSAHMELLMEKLSARGESAEVPVILIEEYWQTLLPDPDGPEAIPVDTFVHIKETLDASATASPSHYLRGLQDCVISAARGGALRD